MGPKNPNKKEGGNGDNMQEAESDVETVDLLGYVPPQGFESNSEE